MKPKSNLHDEMLLDGTIHFGRHSDGRMFEDGKPIEPAADVIVRPPAKVNPAPRVTDEPPTPKVSEQPATRKRQLHGLERAIAANVARGGRPAHTTSSSHRPTGLMRAIEANIRDQESKPKP